MLRIPRESLVNRRAQIARSFPNRCTICRARHNPRPRSVKFDGEICGGVLVENASDDFPQQKKLENLPPNFAGSSPPISPKTSPTSLWKSLVLKYEFQMKFRIAICDLNLPQTATELQHPDLQSAAIDNARVRISTFHHTYDLDHSMLELLKVRWFKA